jgi:hypothetical protein
MTIVSKPWKLYNAAKKAFTGGAQKTTGTGAINTTNISKNLKEFQKHKEDIIKSTDKHSKGLTTEGSINVKKTVAPALSKLSKLTQKLPEKKAKGGRVGLKGGSNLGMQSVKYGLDNKPEVTKLDRIAKFIAKDKKKKNKKFKTPMDQAVKKDKKKKRFV